MSQVRRFDHVGIGSASLWTAAPPAGRDLVWAPVDAAGLPIASQQKGSTDVRCSETTVLRRPRFLSE